MASTVNLFGASSAAAGAGFGGDFDGRVVTMLIEKALPAMDRSEAQQNSFQLNLLHDPEGYRPAIMQYITSYQDLCDDPEGASQEFVSSATTKLAFIAYTNFSEDQKVTFCEGAIKALIEGRDAEKPAFVTTAAELGLFITSQCSILNIKKSSFQAVLEVFDALPKLDVSSAERRLIDKSNNQLLNRLLCVYQSSDSALWAYGIEEAQGGFKALLNTMLEGVSSCPGIRKKVGFGLLIPGSPSIYAGPHGPFYVVAADKTHHHAYIVPSHDHVTVAHQALDLACEKGLITSEEKIAIAARVVSAEEVCEYGDECFKSNDAFVAAIIEANSEAAPSSAKRARKMG